MAPPKKVTSYGRGISRDESTQEVKKDGVTLKPSELPGDVAVDRQRAMGNPAFQPLTKEQQVQKTATDQENRIIMEGGREAVSPEVGQQKQELANQVLQGGAVTPPSNQTFPSEGVQTNEPTYANLGSLGSISPISDRFLNQPAAEAGFGGQAVELAYSTVSRLPFGIGDVLTSFINDKKIEAVEDLDTPANNISKELALANQYIRDVKKGIDIDANVMAFEKAISNVQTAHGEFILESRKESADFFDIKTRERLEAFEIVETSTIPRLRRNMAAALMGTGGTDEISDLDLSALDIQ